MGNLAVTTLGVALAIIIIVGAALALCRRYCIGWQWDARNVWSICVEWRQRLSWLWAPREEKVGLVKAQHPTAQTLPSLYRQSSNTSQHLLHSDSDIRLDAQGAFTRFEAVDRDLHPSTGSGNLIPPQPLRPAPQPKSTARPRPSPLQTPSASEYIRMQETGPGPLTPPPIPRGSGIHRGSGTPIFAFHDETEKNYSLYGKLHNGQSTMRVDAYPNLQNVSNRILMTPYTLSDTQEVDSSTRYELRYGGVDNYDERVKDPCFMRNKRDIPYQHYDLLEDAAKLRYSVPSCQLNERGVKMMPEESRSNLNESSHDLMIKNQHHTRQHVRNDTKGSFDNFNFTNSNNTHAQAIIESIYSSQNITKLLQNNEIHGNDHGKINENTQNIEMTSFRNSNIFQDEFNCAIQGNMKVQGLQRVSQYIQSLPDVPVYDSLNNEAQDDQMEDEGGITPGDSELASSPVPPPAPQDPLNSMEILRKDRPTTGERIFSALRSVTSQSYIDASEFYNSVLSSAQQVPMLAFPTIGGSSIQLNKHSSPEREPDEVTGFYDDGEQETISIDGRPRTSDLYSPELNLAAHRTAQEVYNSLQDPPSSPLLLKDLSQEPYSYMSDPSFTRTSEDIFNSLEKRRKSMERLNGLHDYIDMGNVDTSRRRSSQDLYNAFEEVQMKRRLSETLEDSYGYINADTTEANLGNRRGSQGPEPEPPPDVTNLKRAISCESVCSDTSVSLGDLDEITVVGHVCIGLEFERWGGRGVDAEGDLAVSVLEARDLIAPDGRPAQDTLARVCLLPDRQTHVQTRLYRGSPSPSYQEKFLFPLDGGPIGRALLVQIFSIEIGTGSGVFLLGEASLKLGPAARPPATTWLPLISSSLPVPYVGELMFSLSYLPTAERLTLVVAKARNLVGVSAVPGDFFVKVYLLQHGKKMHKKKTSTKRNEKSPTFNEAMIFNVPAHALQNIQLRLTVAELKSDATAYTKAYSVGHIIIGSNATGKLLLHWRQMLTALRRPVALWHPLRK